MQRAYVLGNPIGSSPQLGILQLSGAMLYPHEERARERYFAACLGNSFARLKHAGQEFPEIPSDVQLNLARASGIYWQVRAEALAPAIVGPKAAQGRTMHGGVLAGAQILTVIALAQQTEMAVGRAKADAVLMDWLARSPRYFKKINRFAMGQNWRKYRGAAHLWGALHILGRMPTSMQELIAFTSAAERPRPRRRAVARFAGNLESDRRLPARSSQF